MTQLGVNYLGLRSLKEISDGDVVIVKNQNLCYTNKSHWEGLFKSKSQSATVEDNAEAAACGKLNFVSHTEFSEILFLCCRATSDCAMHKPDLINQI